MKVMNLLDQTRVVQRYPQGLNQALVSELIDLVQKVELLEEAKHRSKATHWAYRVPFPGVRYYAYE